MGGRFESESVDGLNRNGWPFCVGICSYYFTSTGYYDQLPAAVKMARDLGYSPEEMVEAICKVADKARSYPPTKNRASWFAAVFREKLSEARADILAFRKRRRL